MSRFFSSKYKNLTPYTPGEQPRDMQYIKLNTNESPFPPSPLALEKAAEAAKKMQLYPDPTYHALHSVLAEYHGVGEEQVLATNGSDEILNFAFMAFCDESCPAVFPNITYGFYSVFATLNHVPYVEVPLLPDFSVDVEALLSTKGTIFLANPNAPTGLCLPLDVIEKIVVSDKNRVVVVDEAYVDFGGESAISLIPKYDNLLVTRTFSKSRSMAGARLGYGVGAAALMADMNTVKYSTNPYNVNMMSAAAGLGAMQDEAYTQKNCQTVIENRTYAENAMRKLGFVMTQSKGNFLFAKHPKVGGEEIYLELRKRGVLVRHFRTPLIADYNRITVGTRAQMEALVAALTQILEEKTV